MYTCVMKCFLFYAIIAYFSVILCRSRQDEQEEAVGPPQPEKGK